MDITLEWEDVIRYCKEGCAKDGVIIPGTMMARATQNSDKNKIRILFSPDPERHRKGLKRGPKPKVESR